MAKKIFIDPGHGGVDSGAVGNNMLEKTINLEVSLALRDFLVASGHDVKMSRLDDSSVDLSARPAMANQWGADIFVSVHHNAGGGDGYEVIDSVYHGVGEQLANMVADEFKALGQNGHGAHAVYSRPGDHGDYYCVIRESNMAAIISEFGFIDTTDAQAFDTTVERKNEALAIGKAINRLFSVPNPSIPSPVTVTPPISAVDGNVLNQQKILNRFGFKGANGARLVEDGVLGDNTKYAVSSFQRVAGLEVDGIAGPITMNAMYEIMKKPTLSVNNTYRIPTRYLQWRVGTTIDGAFGNGTKGAVINWQSRNGLVGDGIVGTASWASLIGY